jgi:hypothetical protein
VAGAASSLILDAGRRIAALNRQYDQADVAGSDWSTVEAIWMQTWAHERTILDAIPSTITEAMVVMMIAAGNLNTASASDDAGDMVAMAMHAAERAIRFLASAEGVTPEEFGAGFYLLERAAPSCAGRVA